MTAAQILQAARSLIAERKHWTKDVLALDKRRRAVWPTDAAAVKFCALGAFGRVAGITKPLNRQTALKRSVESALRHLRTAAGGSDWDIIYVNNKQGHKATLEMFDNAISRAKKGSKA